MLWLHQSIHLGSGLLVYWQIRHWIATFMYSVYWKFSTVLIKNPGDFFYILISNIKSYFFCKYLTDSHQILLWNPQSMNPAAKKAREMEFLYFLHRTEVENLPHIQPSFFFFFLVEWSCQVHHCHRAKFRNSEIVCTYLSSWVKVYIMKST